MPRKYLIVFFFMAFVGARHAVPLQGLVFADVPLSQQDPCPPECVTDSMEIVTWYPSPYNEYEELRLYPVQRDDNYCDNDKIGLMYYDDGGTPSFGDNDKIRVCKGTSLGWQEVGGADFWKASTTVSSNIYTDKSVKFGSYSTAGRPTCNADTLGAVIFDTNKNNLYLCKLGAWEPVGGYSYTQSFTIPGTYTFVVPNGIAEIMIEAWSAGGGGGGAYGGGFSGSIGGGGGSSSVGSLIFASGGNGGNGGNSGGSGGGGNGGTSSAPINISGQNGTSGGGGGAGGFGAGNGGSGGPPGQGSIGGGGGGGGAYGKGTFNVTSGALYTIVVGAGGTGGAGAGCQGTGNLCCCSYPAAGGGTGGNGKAIIYY